MTSYLIESSETSALESERSPSLQRWRIVFRKGEEVRFLSHLDLMATLEYAMRRAQLPLALAEGFNPRPRMSLAAPLAVGYVGEREVLEITLRERRDSFELRDALQRALPKGIVIHDAIELSPEERSAASRVIGATYRVELPENIKELTDRVTNLLLEPSLPVEEAREGRIRRRDIRPLISGIDVVDDRTLRLQIGATADGTVRPELVLTALGVESAGVVITREGVGLGD